MKTYIKRHSLLLVKTVIVALLFGVIFSACQEPLDTDYSGYQEDLLFVEGKITTDTTQHLVVLTRTISLDEHIRNWETGAEVSIKNGSNVIPLTEAEDGHYYTADDVYGVVGQTYELNIETQGGDFVTAITSIPNIPEIDSVTVEWRDAFYGYYMHQVFYHGWELEEEGNAYLWNLIVNDTLYNDTLIKSTYVNDDFVNGNYIGVGEKQVLDTITGEYYTELESNFAIYALDHDELNTDLTHITVEMESIPQDYYIFLNTLISQTVMVGSPFEPVKADLTTNIEGEGLGYFYGASVKRFSLMYERPEESIDYEPPF